MQIQNPSNERSNLITQLAKFDDWRESQHGLEVSDSSAYPDWLQFSKAFVQFLQLRSETSWTHADDELIAQACSRDWKYDQLLSTLPDDDRTALMLRPYSHIRVRMYMLVSSRYSKSISAEVALAYFENDQSEAIRHEALKTLSRLKWPHAEQHALELWNTRKTVERIVALDCLQMLQSPLLNEYLEKALNAGDSNLGRQAAAITRIENSDNLQWPTGE